MERATLPTYVLSTCAKLPRPNEQVNMHAQKCRVEHTLAAMDWGNKDPEMLESHVFFYGSQREHSFCIAQT